MVEAQQSPVVEEAPEVAPDEPRRSRPRLRVPRLSWASCLAVVLVVLLLAEGYVRLVERHLPTVRAGDAAEMIIKARQIDALAAEQGEQVDVVVFGTSMMDSATSPSTILARSKRYDSVYNAAIVGAPLATQVRWADEIVLDRLEPDLIVLGIHPVDLLLGGVLDLNIRPAQADVVFSRVLRETGEDPIAAVDRWLHDHVALVRQRGALRQPRTMWDATLKTVTGQEPDKFFALRDETFWFEHLTPLGESSMFRGDPFEVKGFYKQLRERLRTDQFATGDLHRLLELVSDTDARVVVVIPPVPLTSWRDGAVDLSALEEGVEIITEAAAEHGVEVIDFTDSGYRNELFADMLHSNDKGAVQFSTELAARLDGLG